MKRLATATCLALALLATSAQGARRQKAPDGLIELSRQMIDLEARMTGKLEEDAEAWKKEVELFHSAIGRQLSTATLLRGRLERAALAIKLGRSFASPETRRAVLVRLAAVDLAIDDLARSQAAEVRRLDERRAKALAELIGLLKRIRGSQVELVAYLEDPSLAKRLGQIDVGSIATTVAEARRVRASLAADKTVDFAAEKQRIEDQLNEAREFLSVLERATEKTGSEP